MRKTLYACGLVLLVAGLPVSCGGQAPPSPGSYQVIQKYTVSTLPPVTIGKSVITYEPVMDFPAGSLELYQACLKDVAKMNNVDYGG